MSALANGGPSRSARRSSARTCPKVDDVSGVTSGLRAVGVGEDGAGRVGDGGHGGGRVRMADGGWRMADGGSRIADRRQEPGLV